MIGVGVAHNAIVTQFSAALGVADLSWDHLQQLLNGGFLAGNILLLHYHTN